MAKYPSDEADRFQIRLPAGLRDQIADLAKAAGRSMNTELVRAVEYWLHVNSAPAPSLTTEEREARESPDSIFESVRKLEAAGDRLCSIMEQLEAMGLRPATADRPAQYPPGFGPKIPSPAPEPAIAKPARKRK